MRRAWPALFIACISIATGTAQQGIPRMTVFPQVVAGGAWSSDFFITNQGTMAIQEVELSLFKDIGDPMVVDTSDFGSASIFKFDLQPGETRIIRATRGPEPADVQGFAELFCPSGASVRAAMIIRYARAGQIVSQLGVPEQFPFSHFSFPGEVSAQANTGIAIAIPAFGYGDVPDQDVLVSVTQPNGTIIGTKVVPLAARRHTAFILGELFPTLQNFSGRVLVSGPDWLGVTALRIEGETLGAVAVDEGIALAPFFLGAVPKDETEPNDDQDSAQAVASTAVVSGVIGSNSDVDLYRFTARRGEIVSVLVETTSSDAASDLDSQLSLLKADGTEIAWNDQNGTDGKPRDDSLIRMVIPSNGTYYIRVSDYRGMGGPAFTYKLHLKVQAP